MSQPRAVNSLAEAIKLARCGPDTQYLRRGLIAIPFLLAIGVGCLGIVVWQVASGLSITPTWIFIAALFGWMAFMARKAVLVEANRIVKDERICARCGYPIAAKASKCPECGHAYPSSVETP